MAKPIDIPFPIRGLVENASYTGQPPLTTPDSLNVIPFDVQEDRARGGQRPGTSKYVTTQINGTADVQLLDQVSLVLGGFPVTDTSEFTDGFDGTSGNKIATDDSANWLEWVSGAIGSGAAPVVPGGSGQPVDNSWQVTNGTGDIPAPATAVTVEGSQVFEYSSTGEAKIDFTTADTNNHSFALVNQNPYSGFATADYTWTIKTKLTTVDPVTGHSDKYDEDAIMHGVLIRVGTTATNQPVDSNNELENYFVGWYRPRGTTASPSNAYLGMWKFTYDTLSNNQNFVRTFDGNDPVDLGTTGDTTKHSLEIRVRSGDIWVFWDDVLMFGGVQKISTKYQAGGDLFALFAAHIKDSDTATARAPLLPTWDDFQIAPSSYVSDGAISEQLVGVAGGTVKILDTASTPAWSTLVNGTNAATTGMDSTVNTIRGVQYNAKFYMVDGNNYRYYDLTTNTLVDWNAGDARSPDEGDTTPPTSAPMELPGGDQRYGGQSSSPDGNARASIIAVFRDRIWLAGLADDAQNWHALAVGDPTNADTDAFSNTANTAAVAGNNSELGRIGDNITALIPYFDQALIFGCQHSIWVLDGDPGFGGSLLAINRQIGVLSPDAWAFAPDKSVYFMGTNGLYRVFPNTYNIDISKRISLGKLDRTLGSLNADTHRVQLTWDTLRDGLWIFVTVYSTGESTHYFWDKRTGGFWPQRLPDNTGPTAAHEFSDRDSANRAILLGTRRGYVLRFNGTSTNDDGGDDVDSPISSHFKVGPLALGYPAREFKLNNTIVQLDEGSNDVAVEYQVGDTAEGALGATLNSVGTASAGRNNGLRGRYRGYAGYYKLSNTTADETWQFENLTADVEPAGRVRSRT